MDHQGTSTEGALERTTRAIEARLDRQEWVVDGEDLLPLLMVPWLQKQRDPPSFAARIRAGARTTVKLAVGDLLRATPWPAHLTVQTSADLRTAPFRFVMGFGFPWEDRRLTGPLESLLDALGDPAAVLGVTNRADVYEGLTRRGMAAALLRPPRVSIRPEVRAAPLPWGERSALSYGLWIGEWVRALLDERRPKAVITCQDFHPFDQALASSARSRGIPSLTHQHGMIPEGGSLYRILTSDRIALWGRRSAEKLSAQLPEERLWVVGTDRFKHLIPQGDAGQRDRVVLALNPAGDDLNLPLVRDAIAGFAAAWGAPFDGLRLVVKLHQSMDPRLWERRIRALPGARGLPLDLQQENGAKLLRRACVLAAHRSTITLDAAITGAAVLEIDTPTARSPVPAFFATNSEAVLPPDRIGPATARLLEDAAGAAALHERQAASLDEEIASHDAPAAIAAWLESLE